MEIKKIEEKLINKEYVKKALEILGQSKDLTELQKDYFIELCIMYQLNPLKKEIYVVPYNKGEKISIIVAYQIFQNRAEEFPQFDGYSLEWMDKNEDGTLLPLAMRKILFKGYRKDRNRPMETLIHCGEWLKSTGLWTEKPLFMLEKTAISIGLRRLFPLDFNGMPFADVEQWDKEVMEKIKAEVKIV